MRPLRGFAPPTDGCDCDICRVLRSHMRAEEFEFSSSPPAAEPPKPRVDFMTQLKDELRRRGM